MKALRQFEIQAIRLMADRFLTEEQLRAVFGAQSPSSFEYTGSGYFLSIEDPCLPQDDRTVSDPVVIGTANGVRAGFVLYLGKGELTLECHTWGEVDVPADFRNMNVAISTTTPVTITDLKRRGGLLP